MFNCLYCGSGVDHPTRMCEERPDIAADAPGMGLNDATYQARVAFAASYADLYTQRIACSLDDQRAAFALAYEQAGGERPSSQDLDIAVASSLIPQAVPLMLEDLGGMFTLAQLADIHEDWGESFLPLNLD